MAKKKAEDKVVMERTYNVPLRKGFQKAPKYRRAKKAAIVLKEFLVKHMKSDNVKIGKFLNLEIWKNGMRNPPHHVKITVKKLDSGVVHAELEGAEAFIRKEEAKKARKEKKKGKGKKAGTKDKEIKHEEEKEGKDTKSEQIKDIKPKDKASEEKELKEALGGDS